MVLALLIEAGAGAWSGVWLARLADHGVGTTQIVDAAYLAVLAVAFEEAGRRAARLKLRLSTDLKVDMTSVWGVAAALSLPTALAVILMIAVSGYVWVRHNRRNGEALYRRLFNSAVFLLCCLTAAQVHRQVLATWPSLPWQLSGGIAVVLGVLAYTLVNRLLVLAAMASLGVRARAALIGSKNDNLIELATLCLGGLASTAIILQPLLAALVIAPMVTLQRGAVVRELEAAATTDAKTGLLNAVAWEELAARELSRAGREHSSVGFLIIDIDRFKLVNDNFGHLVGDAVLERIGRILSGGVREYDTVARFGGEEFVAVLPQATVAESLVVAERLRSRVNDLRMSAVVAELTGPDERLAVSIGVAVAPADGDELPDLLHAADNALYRAKATGRNRVVLAEPGLGGGESRLLA